MRRFTRDAILALFLAASSFGPRLTGDLLGAQPEEPAAPQADKQRGSAVRADIARPVPPAGKVITNSIGMKLVLIPPGQFEMGSSEKFIESEGQPDSAARDIGPYYGACLWGERGQHTVRITKPYWLAATLTTQAEYYRVMGANPSHFRGDPRLPVNQVSLPVEQVSWHDAVEFCRKLSELPEEKAAKRHYQLPTEAQWEYACRAGNPKAWYFSRREGAATAPEERKLLLEHAWCSENSGCPDNGAWMTRLVAKKKPSPWGLYDMYGNVSEWCQDWYTLYAKAPVDDPTGPL